MPPTAIRFNRTILVFSLMALLAMVAQIILATSVRADQPLYNKTTPDIAVTAPVQTQNGTVPAIKGETPSADAMQFAKAAGTVCPGKWESPECLKVISQSNYMMLANYGSGLQEAGHKAEAEQVKQHCAASTAAREQTFPAYAMKSAFIECMNLLSDVVEKTGMKPDMSEFQLLGASTLCLGKDPRCESISNHLKTLAAQR